MIGLFANEGWNRFQAPCAVAAAGLWSSRSAPGLHKAPGLSFKWLSTFRTIPINKSHPQSSPVFQFGLEGKKLAPLQDKRPPRTH
ncbi:unnamed protein product [Nezara viridula]|uniref:Uncharacterized protein n=1 Tax=Nezara viridula TaxID=85310 RepID=A0A9P0HK64_NEZVI|nr:unnamed protein product [Nezara viridula]